MPTTPAVGKYEVLGKLAETPTAELFVARTANGAPQRFVVLKRLRRDVARDLARVKAFLDRAKLVSHIEHPNVAQVHDLGRLGGSYYAALELVDGETIASMIEHARATKIPMPVRVVLTLAAGAAAGLHHAHERRMPDGKLLGIVHGNLSPASVMVSREGIVKLVGFARVPETRDVAYSSPELRDGRPIDRRSDLYSLGLVLWELLTLEPLPRDDSAGPPSPSSKRYEIPKDLDAIIEKLLAKNPDDRYATAGDLLAAIESLAAKLELALSTNDLARVMRLWYGEPGAGENDDIKAVTVEPDAVPPDLVAGASPVDAMLDDVRANAAAIRRLVATTSATPTTRRQRTTQVPLGDAGAGDLRESFEQIRDRILSNARPKRDTGKVENDNENGDERTRKKPETLNPTNQYSYITNVKGKAAEPLRAVTGTTPPTGAPTDIANVAVAKVGLAKVELRIEEKNRATDPDKVIVDLPPESAPLEATRAKTATGTDLEAETRPMPKLEAAIAKIEPEPEAKPEELNRQDAEVAKPEPKPEPKTEKTEKTEPIETTEKVARVSKPSVVVEDDEADDEPPPARAPWLVPVLAAGVAVAAIAIVLVLHGGNNHTAAAPSPPPPRPVRADAGVQVAVATPDARAIAPPVDAAIAAVPTVPVDAPQVAAVPPPDAAPVIHVDAATVATVAPDAAEHHHHHEPPPDESTEPRPSKPPKDERTIEQLFDAGEFDKASTGCTATTQFNTPRLIDCALAACHVKDAALAKRWTRAIGATDRATVAAQCHDLGVDLDGP